MQLTRQTAKLVVRVLPGMPIRCRQDPRAGPARLAARLRLINDMDGASLLRRVPCQRQADHTAANNQHIVHDLMSSTAASYGPRLPLPAPSTTNSRVYQPAEEHFIHAAPKS